MPRPKKRHTKSASRVHKSSKMHKSSSASKVRAEDARVERFVLMALGVVVLTALILFVTLREPADSKIEITGFTYTDEEIESNTQPRMDFSVHNDDTVARNCITVLNLTQNGKVVKRFTKDVGELQPDEIRQEAITFTWPPGETEFVLTIICR